jgi:ADP-ribose pyrophosphatase YjhB (NUDIX family)/uncharacterized membrane protein YqjE
MKETIKAAGGIVWKKFGGVYKLAIVYRERYGKEWSLPKGKLLAGEQWHEAAIREVAEEVSVNAAILSFADIKNYPVNGEEKTVVYFHMLAQKPSVLTPDTEVKKVEWVTPEEAAGMLTHSDDIEIVKDLTFPGKPASGLSQTFRSLFAKLGIIESGLSPRQERLESEIRILQKDLRLRTGNSTAGRAGSAQSFLDMAEADLKRGALDSAWKAVHAARRMMVYGLSHEELENERKILLEETDKLNEWRKKSIRNILGQDSKEEKKVTASDLARALEMRDDHYNNNYYKNRITRETFNLLLIILFALIAVILITFAFVDIQQLVEVVEEGTRTVQTLPMLWCVIIFGFLGGCISSLLHIRDASKTTRIPELVNDNYITFTRVFIGGATALVLYFFLESGFSDLFIEGITLRPDSAYTILIISFASGFSERLLLRAISTITGKE